MQRVRKNIHMLESEVNVLNNECEKLSDLKEKSRNSLQMSSFGNNPIFVEKAQVNMEKEIPTIGKSQAIYREEGKLAGLSSEERLAQRQLVVKPLVDAFFAYLK